MTKPSKNFKKVLVLTPKLKKVYKKFCTQNTRKESKNQELKKIKKVLRKF